jgi:hypothetical protein
MLLSIIACSFQFTAIPSAFAAKQCDLLPTLQKIVPAPARKPIVLFEQMGRSTNEAYNEIVDKLKAGDVIQFGDGSQNTIREILGEGHGNITRVFEDTNGEIVRIPLRDTERELGDFNSFREENELLKAAGVPVVDMITEKNIPFQKIVLKRDPFQFRLSDYLNHDTGVKLTKAQQNEIEDKLLEFARKTWRYKRICDFRPEQMAFTKKGEWVLFDMSRASGEIHEELLFDLKGKGNVFSPAPYVAMGLKDEIRFEDVVPKKLYGKIEDAIREERKFQRKNFHWLKRESFDEYSLVNRLTLDPVPEGTTLIREPTCIMSRVVVGNDCPMTEAVSVTILKHVMDEKSFGIYSVKLTSGKLATLKLLKGQDEDAFKSLRKAIKKTTEQGSLLESGNDFVLLKP